MKKADSGAIIKFTAGLVILISLAFTLHGGVNSGGEFSQLLNEEGLVKSYAFNSIIAWVIFLSLMYLKEKHLASLGFFFLGGSLLKLVLFFVFFRPVYAEDGIISKTEFSEFFIPYGLCLIFEVYYLVKILMKD